MDENLLRDILSHVVALFSDGENHGFHMVNLTPSEIRLFDGEGASEVLPPSGKVATVEYEKCECGRSIPWKGMFIGIDHPAVLKINDLPGRAVRVNYMGADGKSGHLIYDKLPRDMSMTRNDGKPSPWVHEAVASLPKECQVISVVPVLYIGSVIVALSAFRPDVVSVGTPMLGEDGLIAGYQGLAHRLDLCSRNACAPRMNDKGEISVE